MQLRLGVIAGVVLTLLTACGGGGDSSQFSAQGASSEADGILHLDQLRAAGYTGKGVRIGVISTGVQYLASYQKAGTLPGSIYVSQNTAGSLDEGSWMLELVHEYAPDAELGFCDGLDLDFDGCITDLANNFHADVVVDDILFSGQFYPDATADVVAQLEAANPRFVFVHLAGNEQNGGYWQGGFTPTTLQIGGGTKTVLDFGAASGAASDAYETITVPANAHLILLLNWNDAPQGTDNRALSAWLLDSAGNILSQASAQGDPNLRLDYTPSTTQIVRLAVSLDSGAADGLAVQLTEGAPTCNIDCQPLSHSSGGLAGGTVGDFDDALVVGAVKASAPNTLEAWSNAGPFRLDFSATPDSAAPGGYDYQRLPAPIYIDKPDLVAPDCVTTPFSNGSTLENEAFCGTSAAVPGVAGAVALLQSAGLDRTTILSALRSTAKPLGAESWSPAYGYGLADAEAALKAGGK